MGGEGEMAHLGYHLDFIRRDYIFTLCIPYWNWKMQWERWQIKTRMAAFGKGRLVANRRVGMKENQVPWP